MVQSQRHDIIGISETWWDESCDWSAMLDSYRHFRRDRQGRQGVEMSYCVMKGLECTELAVGNGTVEILWVRIKGLSWFETNLEEHSKLTSCDRRQVTDTPPLPASERIFLGGKCHDLLIQARVVMVCL